MERARNGDNEQMQTVKNTFTGFLLLPHGFHLVSNNSITGNEMVQSR